LTGTESKKYRCGWRIRLRQSCGATGRAAGARAENEDEDEDGKTGAFNRQDAKKGKRVKMEGGGWRGKQGKPETWKPET